LSNKGLERDARYLAPLSPDVNLWKRLTTSGLRNVADPMAPRYIDCMIAEKIPAVKDLTPAERLQLAAELWGSVAESQDQIPVADEVKRLLDARFAHYQKHPETATTWDELKRRLGKAD